MLELIPFHESSCAGYGTYKAHTDVSNSRKSRQKKSKRRGRAPGAVRVHQEQNHYVTKPPHVLITDNKSVPQQTRCEKVKILGTQTALVLRVYLL